MHSLIHIKGTIQSSKIPVQLPPFREAGRIRITQKKIMQKQGEYTKLKQPATRGQARPREPGALRQRFYRQWILCRINAINVSKNLFFPKSFQAFCLGSCMLMSILTAFNRCYRYSQWFHLISFSPITEPVPQTLEYFLWADILISAVRM